LKEFWGKLSTVNKVGLFGALIGFTVGMVAVVIAGKVMGLFIVACCVALLVFCVWFFFGREFRSNKIKRDGVPAQATILEVRSTGNTINEVYPEIELLLEVRPAEGEPYRAKTTSLIDQVDMSAYRPGDVISVTVDRKNKKKVAV
jgi:hypothetical protein